MGTISVGWSGLGRGCRMAAEGLRRAAADFVYPPACGLCRTDLCRTGRGRARVGLCPECLGKLAPPAERICERCGAPVGPNLPLDGCGYCRRERYAFERVIRLGMYQDDLRLACLRAKSPGQGGLVSALAELLASVRTDAFAELECAGVVPVPQHWRERHWRRPHAARSLARLVARRLQVPFWGHILLKTRRTPAQTELTPTQRRTNLRKAFRAHARPGVAGRRVLLVDDVLTTGATANECAKALRRAGVETVVVAVLARALGQRA